MNKIVGSEACELEVIPLVVDVAGNVEFLDPAGREFEMVLRPLDG